MAKLNLTQVNYVVDTLETVATQTIDHIVSAMRDQWLPPKLTDKEILKALYKEISDASSPKSIRWLLEGRPYPIEKERLAERDTAYQQIAQLETQMTMVAESYIRETKGKLLFEDTWLQKIDRFFITEESDLDYLMDYLKEELNLG